MENINEINQKEEIIINLPPLKEKAKRKIWLCGLAQTGDYDILKETIDPIWDFFEGLVYVFHNQQDEAYKYLEEKKKNGKIINEIWSGRFDFARNHILWCGPIQVGDWVLVKDGYEFIERSFLDVKLEPMLDFFDEQLVDSLFICGKIFVFKYSDEIEYLGGVHENLSGLAKGVELTKIPSLENKDEYFKNLRPQKRDKYHFVKHYLTYYLLRSSARQCLHGLSTNYTDPKEIQQKWIERETMRREFKDYLRAHKIPLNPQDIILYLTQHKNRYSPKMLRFLNSEKILNDVYRYYIENRTDFEDDQDQKNLIEIRNN